MSDVSGTPHRITCSNGASLSTANGEVSRVEHISGIFSQQSLIDYWYYPWQPPRITEGTSYRRTVGFDVAENG